jgi:hypothetical protein
VFPVVVLNAPRNRLSADPFTQRPAIDRDDLRRLAIIVGQLDQSTLGEALLDVGAGLQVDLGRDRRTYEEVEDHQHLHFPLQIKTSGMAMLTIVPAMARSR